MARRRHKNEQLNSALTDAKGAFRTAWILAAGEACAEFPFVGEFHFDATGARKWRLDWACPASRVAVEVDGIGYKRSDVGRHQMGEGFEEDCLKLNTALAQGWAVFRFTPAMLERDPAGCVEMVQSVMARRESVHG
ncbi:MAG: hypothetical protein IPJ01_12145 [Micavibrio sp.]|nr:hypothetical protein [Micavibrio sp.]